MSEELVWRGLIKDKTFANNDWLNKPGAFYLGIDASAGSLTVGNLAIIILARRLAAAGWNAYLLMGGGTSLVGDPGGKNEERSLMSRETVISNIAGVQTQVTKLFKDEKYTLVDNYDWLSKLKYVDFLREVGKHFSMTELMQRDFVVERMGKDGTGISYAEFSYSLVQGYDFWHLFKKDKVVMQIGGSDQWGNLLSGVSLIRKKEGKDAHALSMPLVINKATGQKFGKSEAGAIWLDETKTSSSDFFQFWVNADDQGVDDYLKIYTLLSKEQIEAVMNEFRTNPGGRKAQYTLALEVTTLVHGRAAAELALAEAKTLKINISEQVNVSEATKVQVDQGASVIETLVLSGLANSKSDARRLLESGGIYINDQPTSKSNFDTTDFNNDGLLKLRRGKTLQNTVIIEQK